MSYNKCENCGFCNPQHHGDSDSARDVSIKTMRLSDLKTGELGMIVKVHGHGSFQKRITEMGFVYGNKVRVILNAPLMDPIEYEIIGYKISLRRDEADRIEVVGENEIKDLPDSRIAHHTLEASHCDDDEHIERRMMQLASERKNNIRIALVGNPNCGKTSLFNVLSGGHEHVGNYSGVTVDAKEGYLEYGGYHITLIDLPGTYSLSEYSPEELYVRKNLVENVPDIVINVVDAMNLERNLYLTAQLIDMDLRIVLALNMYDELRKSDDKLDAGLLGQLLGMPVVPTVSRSGEGKNELLDTVIKVYERKVPNLSRHIHINHGEELEASIRRLQLILKRDEKIRQKYSTRFLAIKYLERDAEIERIVEALPCRDELIATRYEEDKRIERLLGQSPENMVIDSKYAFIRGALKETFTPSLNSRAGKLSVTDRIDRIVTNRWLAFPIFLLVLFIIFQGTFSLGNYPMTWIEDCINTLGRWFSTSISNSLVRDMVVEGIIGGVGSVLVFLPNILILYLFISILEDTGYMARAAFIMDKVMHRIGLHGKSFIPMIMGFGCNVPAIMATRTIESRRSRLITMMIIPFMSCTGRLPIYILLTAVFFPFHASFVLLGLYVTGIIAAIFSANIIGKFIKEEDMPFVMELPPYRMPNWKSVLRHTWEKGWQYLQKMGGVILVCSIAIWALGYFPRGSEGMSESEQQDNSYIAHIGKTIEPVFQPLGFDWKMSTGLLAGIGAKELVVSTLGVMYSNGDVEAVDDDPNNPQLQSALAKAITPAAALAYMVFVLLYFPCLATFAAIKNESGGWKWACISATYTLCLAWVVSYGVYFAGKLFM